jgi:hypothetical protein
MPSFVWRRDPQEAFENPYEYEAQEQFYREASKLLKNLFKLLASEEHHLYYKSDKSVEKAIWLLHMDALDSLFDSLEALKTKRHRTTGKLFRNIEETLDLAALFSIRTEKSDALLEKWFDDEVIPHRKYREYIEKIEGKIAAKEKAAHYAKLSKFIHRTYLAIMEGYSLGNGEKLVHDRKALIYSSDEHPEAETFMVVPSTISAYCAALASEILFFCDELHKRGTLGLEDISSAKKNSAWFKTVPLHLYN